MKISTLARDAAERWPENVSMLWASICDDQVLIVNNTDNRRDGMVKRKRRLAYDPKSRNWKPVTVDA